MKTNSFAEQKWWKIGAATFLSVGLLAACGDDNDDPDVDDNIHEDMDQDVNDDTNAD